MQAVTRLFSTFASTLPTFKERLALLYVLNDIIFHAVNTYRDTKSFIPSATTQYLTPLLNSVKSAPNTRSEPIDKLLKLWSEKRYFTEEEYSKITGLPMKATTASISEDQPKRKPLVKPAMLGMSGDPYWLLPVSCMLEIIVHFS